jgi:hypothetical protein
MFFFKQRPAAPQANRRETYRTLPEGVGELGVTVVGEGMSPLSAELVDLSLYGVGVRLQGSRHASLAAGELYEVRIGSQYHPEIATPAQLRGAHEEDGSWRYGFEFVDVGGLYEQLDDFFVRHFNRRSNRRMRLTAEERIALTLSWEGGSRKPRWPTFPRTGSASPSPPTSSRRSTPATPSAWPSRSPACRAAARAPPGWRG